VTGRSVAVLVTGMSGTGKSAALAELARRGHQVVDTDDGGWIEDVPSADGHGPEPLWREDRIDALLAEHDGGALFVSGCVANQGRFYPRFDAVVLLSAPADVILERVAVRETNDFGKTDAQRDQILDDLATVEPLLRAGATVEIDTRAPLDEVVDELERIAGTVPRRDVQRASEGARCTSPRG
jgi:shikimate kinase